MKFEKGKRYLVERISKAHGGGLREIHVQNIVKDFIKVNDDWKRLKGMEDSWKILIEIPEDDE